jgi:hypothetical protein
MIEHPGLKGPERELPIAAAAVFCYRCGNSIRGENYHVGTFE